MTKKILVDTDLFIEYFIGRREFKKYFRKLDEMKHSQQYELYVTFKCLERIYLEHGEDKKDLLQRMVNGTIDIDDNIKDEARESHLVDFDSAEELICAIKHKFDAILTLNPQNFDGADLKIISLPALTEKIWDKLRKHLTKVIFGSLPLLGLLGISMLIYLISKYMSDKDLKLVHITPKQMQEVCRNPDFYNDQFKKLYEEKKLTWEYKDNSAFSNIELKFYDSLKEVIPAHRWRCVYTPKDGSNLSAGGRLGLGGGELGLDLKEYCRNEFISKYGDEYGNRDRIDARFLHYDKPDSISCVLTN